MKIVDWGIEELERLIAEGIELGLKVAELRLWVDGERARLKAQREADSKKLQAEREAERLALNDNQEKELSQLNQQLAVLENLLEGKAAEASLVRNTLSGHKNLDIGQTAKELNVPRPDIPESASHETFRYDLKQDGKLLSGNYFGTSLCAGRRRGSARPSSRDEYTAAVDRNASARGRRHCQRSGTPLRKQIGDAVVRINTSSG